MSLSKLGQQVDILENRWFLTNCGQQLNICYGIGLDQCEAYLCTCINQSWWGPKFDSQSITVDFAASLVEWYLMRIIVALVQFQTCWTCWTLCTMSRWESLSQSMSLRHWVYFDTPYRDLNLQPLGLFGSPYRDSNLLPLGLFCFTLLGFKPSTPGFIWFNLPRCEPSTPVFLWLNPTGIF